MSGTHRSPGERYQANEVYGQLAVFLYPPARVEEDESPRLSDTYKYAEWFEAEYKDLVNGSQTSVHVASARLREDGGLEVLPDGQTPAQNDLWLEFATNLEEHGYLCWRLSSGRLQYDLMADGEGNRFATAYEKTIQGAMLRREEVYDEQVLDGLQQLVEAVVGNPGFAVNVQKQRQGIEDDHAKVVELLAQEAQKTINRGGRKSLDELRSKLFKAGFSSGSRDIRDQRPLLNPPDWRPVPYIFEDVS